MGWGLFLQQIVRDKPFGDNPLPDWGAILATALLGVVLPAFFLWFRMETTVLPDRVEIRMAPLSRRIFRPSEITNATARTYRPMREFGGWGIRGWGANKAYNMSGDQGIQLVLDQWQPHPHRHATTAGAGSCHRFHPDIPYSFELVRSPTTETMRRRVRFEVGWRKGQICTTFGTIGRVQNTDDPAKTISAHFYQTSTHREPVREWLMELPIDDRKLVGIDIKTVEFGWPLGMPTCRSLGRDVWEVRSNLTGGRISRVLFAVQGNRMYLLHAFIKKTQKTPAAEIDLALRRLKEILQ